MAYDNLPISRNNPGCILFLIDQSYSMGGRFGGETEKVSKSQGLCDAINRLLQTLIVRCTRDEGVRDYFNVAVIGYNTDHVQSAFQGHWASQDLLPISTISDNPLRIEDRVVKEQGDAPGGIIESTKRFPIWIEPLYDGGTPMCKALETVGDLAEGWIKDHPDNFPPIVLHITDGEANDGDPRVAAENLVSLSTSDGNLLLFNCHLSSKKSSSVLFPNTSNGLADKFAKQLFDMSSILPPNFVTEALSSGLNVQDDARGFAFNVDLVQLIQFIDVGTRVSRQLR